MLEFQGAGVAAQKALMDEKIDTMATLGARMLSVTMNRNETIDTRRIFTDTTHASPRCVWELSDKGEAWISGQ